MNPENQDVTDVFGRLVEILQPFAKSLRPEQAEALIESLGEFRRELASERQLPKSQENRYGPTELYRIYSEAGELLYVGISRSYRKHRLYQHRRAFGHDAANNAVIETFATRQLAEIAEVRIQAAEKPLHGVYETQPDLVEAAVRKIKSRYLTRKVVEPDPTDLSTHAAFGLADYLNTPIEAYDEFETARMLGLSHRAVRTLVRDGKLRPLKVKGRLLIARTEMVRFLDQLEKEQSAKEVAS